MRRIPIRLKLASALALPLAALAVVSALELAESTRWVNEVNRQADIARASIGPSGLLRSLQNERTWPAVELIGFTSMTVPVAGYDETRADTDKAITTFREQIADADPSVQEAFHDALAGLDDLEAIRTDIDTNTAPRTTFNIAFADTVFERYTDVIQPFFSAAETVSLAVDADGELRQGTELANTSSRVIEVLSVMLAYSITDSYLSDGGIDESMEISRISMLQAEFNDYANQLRTAGAPSRASPRSGTRPSSPTPPTSRWTSGSTPGRSTSTPPWQRSTSPRRRATSRTRTPSTRPSTSGPTRSTATPTASACCSAASASPPSWRR